MKKIGNLEEFAKIINSDVPILKDGSLLRDWYTDRLKSNHNSNHNLKEYLRGFPVEILPHSLELFPNYPNFVTFVQWVQEVGFDTQEFYGKLFAFLNEIWTEEGYPERVFERLFVIEHIVGKTANLSSFEWVQKTSPRALEENIWKKYDIKYLFGKGKQEKKEVLLEMGKFSLFSKLYFSSGLLPRIPNYLKDFSKDELLNIFATNKEKVDADTWQLIEKWVAIFSKEN